MARSDPNHYFDRLAELRDAFSSRRFIPTDIRPYGAEEAIKNDVDFGAQYLGLQRLLERLTDEAFERFDEAERAVMADAFGRIRDLMQSIQMESYSSSGSPNAARKGEFSRHYGAVVTVASSSFMTRFISVEGAVSQSVADGRRAIEDWRVSTQETMQNAIAQLQHDAAELQSRIQQDLSQAAVAKNANFFRAEASRYAKLSGWWGGFAAIWLVLVGYAAFLVTFDGALNARYFGFMRAAVPDLSDEALIIQFLSSKLVALGALAVVGVVLIRTFMSCLNLHVLNRHRAVSLDTYKFLLDGAQTDADRQHIIQRAAEAVFAIHETGLIRTSPGGDVSPMNATINLPRIG